MRVGVLLIVGLIVVTLLFVVAWSLFEPPPILGLAVLGVTIPALAVIATHLVQVLAIGRRPQPTRGKGHKNR